MSKLQKAAAYMTLLLIGVTINVIYHWEVVWETWARYYVKDQNIVISMTTTPYRIGDLTLTLQCLARQNVPIAGIYLSVPFIFKRDNIPYNIPEWLDVHPGVTILRTEDYGPATKILGVIKNAPLSDNTIVIAVDDDTCYPKNLALRLAVRAKQNPNAAVGVSGAVLDFEKNKEGGIVKIMRDKVSVPILEGFAGIAYRPRFFDSSIFEISQAPNFCYNSDDLYLSFYLARKNIDRQTVNNKYLKTYDIRQLRYGYNSDALYKLDSSQAQRYKNCVLYLQNKFPQVVFFDNGIN